VIAGQLLVRKRDGRTVDFDVGRISRAVEGAFRAERGLPKGAALDPLPHQ